MKGFLWNARSIKNKKWEISKHIQEYDIACIMETKLKSRDNLRFAGYNIYRHDGAETRNAANGGSVLLVDKHISQSTINITHYLSCAEVVGVRINDKTGPLNISIIFYF